MAKENETLKILSFSRQKVEFKKRIKSKPREKRKKKNMESEINKKIQEEILV